MLTFHGSLRHSFVFHASMIFGWIYIFFICENHLERFQLIFALMDRYACRCKSWEETNFDWHKYPPLTNPAKCTFSGVAQTKNQASSQVILGIIIPLHFTCLLPFFFSVFAKFLFLIDKPNNTTTATTTKKWINYNIASENCRKLAYGQLVDEFSYSVQCAMILSG